MVVQREAAKREVEVGPVWVESKDQTADARRGVLVMSVLTTVVWLVVASNCWCAMSKRRRVPLLEPAAREPSQ